MAQIDIPYFKMNGIGNSILVVDARLAPHGVSPDLARALDARPGFAFDQLMALTPPRTPGTAAYVTIFNADGTRAEACGNGTRCVAWALMRNTSNRQLQVETSAGVLNCERIAAERYAVDMGRPQFAWDAIPLAQPVNDTSRVPLEPVPNLPAAFERCAAVSMGNPHAVFFVSDAGAIDIAAIGPAVEHHPMFPNRTNVSFAQVIDRTAILLRVWERSAGATLACGSAACATAVAAMRDNRVDRSVTVTLPGGALDIAWRSDHDQVVMVGDVALEHAGVLSPDVIGAAA